MYRKDTYQFPTYQWKISEDTGSNDFTSYVDKIIESNQSVHIDGRGGTGKSTLLRLLQQKLKEQGKEFISMAPTNIAARLIGGITVHKYMAEMSNKSMKKNKQLEYIFVDEISMAHEFMYKLFILIKHKYENVKFIIAGDFQQLLPVNDRVDCDYKNSRALYELCDGNRIQLCKCRRADDELFKLCDPNTIMQVDKNIFDNAFTDSHFYFLQTRNEKR